MTEETITKGERTRQAIEDAALKLFLENGYHATSMRQIADQAGLALGGIYNHFPNKEEIFSAIVMDKHPYKKVLPAIVAAEGETVEDFLRSAFKATIAEIGEDPVFIKLMFTEIVEFKGKHGTKMLKEIAPKVLPVLENILKNRKGSLRVTNPAMLLRSFFGMIISFYITEIVVGNSVIEKLMPKNVVDVYLDIYLYGILKEAA